MNITSVIRVRNGGAHHVNSREWVELPIVFSSSTRGLCDGGILKTDQTTLVLEVISCESIQLLYCISK